LTAKPTGGVARFVPPENGKTGGGQADRSGSDMSSSGAAGSIAGSGQASFR
jgi:hypothetical protein